MVWLIVKLPGKAPYKTFVRSTAEANEVKRFIGRSGTVTIEYERQPPKKRVVHNTFMGWRY